MKLSIEDTKKRIYKTLCGINYHPLRFIGIIKNPIMSIYECDLSKIKNITAKEFVNITYNTLKIFTIRKKDNNFIEFACHINVIKHTFELHLRYKRRLKFFVQSNLHDFYKGRYLNDALNMMKDLMNEKDISDI